MFSDASKKLWLIRSPQQNEFTEPTLDPLRVRNTIKSKSVAKLGCFAQFVPKQAKSRIDRFRKAAASYNLVYRYQRDKLVSGNFLTVILGAWREKSTGRRKVGNNSLTESESV